MFANWCAGAALLLISLGWLTPAQAVDIQRWQTAHGAKVLFVASHDNPLLDVRVDFDAGNRRDSADKPVLRRVFAPRDYLPPGADFTSGFLPRSEQPVKLYFELSRVKASGYHIAVFYP